MGLWNWTKSVFTDVDEDEERARGEVAEAGLDREAAKDREKYGEDWYRQYKKHDPLDDVYLDGQSEFETGFEEELDARASAYGEFGDKVISKTVGTVWRTVPLWVWLGLAVAAVVYFWPLIRVAMKIRPKTK
jgi:hypothetical protein